MGDTFNALTTTRFFYVTSDSLFRILLSVVLVVLGFFVAQRVTSFLRNSVRSLLSREFITNSPFGVMTESTDALRGSGLFSNVVYWFVVFFFVSIAGEVLGITFFSNVAALIVSFIPTLISAAIVFLFGLVISGVAENVVKRQLKKMMPQQAVLMGTATSYVVLALFTLIALSELGIASEFILVLFSGLVLALALSVGISIGFGSKGIVEDMLQTMVKEEKKRRTRDEE
ncbi:hypothetical protein LRY65_05420 [Candidatus Woesebacteria bacterium]|nr:hypothetical protein [Candidatus Woesebacteria bacterium]MCD8506702.1 hypothetical protein [Candidatus Woesebacteria bacterium]MCD8527608.1 hypothetical protein [Candidatus Woesebacteria bacterium]MCD8546421.1 hypothetical protein [Candidatus Woesebacteria bacterium]